MYSSFEISSPVKHGAISKSAYFWIIESCEIINSWRICGESVIERFEILLLANVMFIKFNVFLSVEQFTERFSVWFEILEMASTLSNPSWARDFSISKVSKIFLFFKLYCSGNVTRIPVDKTRPDEIAFWKESEELFTVV